MKKILKKIAVMSLLDELNYRNEIWHLMEEEKQAELQKAAETIGKKFASSDL